MDIKRRAEVSVLLLLPFAASAGILSSLGFHFKFLITMLVLLVFFISFINTNFALVILIFSMLFSPEFELGGIPGRAVVLRADDILIFVVLFGWLSKMAVTKQLGLIRTNPINKPIIVYILVCVLATLLGAMQGLVSIKQSFFYLLKYVEYFVLFFMVVNNVKTMRQVKVFVFFLLFTCFLVCIYAWSNIGVSVRVTAPFEGRAGEPNTLGGYLLLMMAVVIGLILHTKFPKQSFVLPGLLVFMTVPFLYTLSRSAWFGFFPMYIALTVMTRRRRAVLLIFLAALIVTFPIFMPQPVKKRLTSTFVPGRAYEVAGRRLTFDESTARRIDTWAFLLKKWVKRPILGYGVPAGIVTDNQYARVLREVGTVGFIIFIWLNMTIFKAGLRTYKLTRDNDFAQGLSLGFLAGFTGLLVQSLAQEVFIIIRIMEPFWFLTAIIVMLPEVVASAEETNT